MIDLFQTGVLDRCPGGGPGEDMAGQVAAGMKWAALNLGTDPCVKNNPGVWTQRRNQYAAAGIPVGPWMHCRSMKDVEFLVTVGFDWKAPFIGCNVEDVVGDKLSLEAVGEYLIRVWKQPVHMPSLPWLQNGQGWQHVAFATIALEMFPEEGQQKYLDQWEACVQHAFSEGAQKVTLLFSTQSPRSVYPNVAHCLYTADNVGHWPDWHDTVPQPIPTPNGGNVPLTPNQKKEFREEIADYTYMAEQYESRWHYSQNRPYRGLGEAPQTFHVDDCSSYCALAFYWAAHHTGVKVSDPLDYHYSGYGNTQSAYEYLKAHKAPKDKYRIGDMAIYGPAYDTVHMMICRKSGTGKTAVWSSFGQEAGPEARTDVHYHPSPLLGIYRHPALL